MHNGIGENKATELASAKDDLPIQPKYKRKLNVLWSSRWVTKSTTKDSEGLPLVELGCLNDDVPDNGKRRSFGKVGRQSTEAPLAEMEISPHSNPTSRSIPFVVDEQRREVRQEVELSEAICDSGLTSQDIKSSYGRPGPTDDAVAYLNHALMEDQNHFSPTDKFTLNSRIPFERRVSSADTNLKFKKRTAPSFLSNDLNAVDSKKARQAICSVSPLRGKEEIPESMQTKQTICTSESLTSLTSQDAKNISELSRLNDDTFVRSSPMSNEHSRPETIEEPMRGNLIISLNSKAPTGLMGLFPEQRLPTELAGGIFKPSSVTDTSRLYGQRDGPGYQEKAFPSSKSISKEVEEPKR